MQNREQAKTIESFLDSLLPRVVELLVELILIYVKYFRLEEGNKDGYEFQKSIRTKRSDIVTMKTKIL